MVVALLPARPDTAYWHEPRGRTRGRLLPAGPAAIRRGPAGRAVPVGGGDLGGRAGDAGGPRRRVGGGMARGVSRPVRSRSSCAFVGEMTQRSSPGGIKGP